MPNQICVLTRRRSLQIKLLTFTFTNFIEEHVDPGERDEIMIVVMIVPARPRPNSNSCDDSFKDTSKYAQNLELGSILVLCNEGENCLYISNCEISYSCNRNAKLC